MIVIVGCDHCLQLPEFTSGFWRDVEQTRRARRQREGFRCLLEQIIRERGCQFVGEETNHGQLTPAVGIAERLGLHYHNIEMTQAERVAAGIPAGGYHGNPAYSDAQQQAWDRIRERHMIDEIQAGRGDCESLLVICGVRHMLPLWQHFQQRGEDMHPLVDVRGQQWFSGPLSSEWLFEEGSRGIDF